MRFALLSLAVLLCCACTDTARVDAFLNDTHTMPADKRTWDIARPPLNAFGVPMTCTGGTDLMPTRASTYARADALAYARLYVKFGGRAPEPFGFDPQTDAAVLALATARAATAEK
jgi:hypothetical protein